MKQKKTAGARRPAPARQAPRPPAAPVPQFVPHARRPAPVQATSKNDSQRAYMEKLREPGVVFGLGPAGTGKTYLAVARAVQALKAGDVARIVLTRPAVEAGEKLGFLPGNLQEKIDPYLRPLYDALGELLGGDLAVKALMEDGTIEIAPLAFLRGRTLKDAYVILDEAQNTTPEQMKMMLTRLGDNACLIVTGDASQNDLPRGARSGLGDAVGLLEGCEGIGVHRFREADIVRSALVARIVGRYEQRDCFRAGELAKVPEPDWGKVLGADVALSAAPAKAPASAVGGPAGHAGAPQGEAPEACEMFGGLSYALTRVAAQEPPTASSSAAPAWYVQADDGPSLRERHED